MRLLAIIKEAIMGAAEYRPPQDASQLMADFYTLGMIATGPEYTESIHQQGLDQEYKHIETTLIPGLRKHMLEMVGYSICCELRHIHDVAMVSGEFADSGCDIERVHEHMLEQGVPDKVYEFLRTAANNGRPKRDAVLNLFNTPQELENTVRVAMDLFADDGCHEEDENTCENCGEPEGECICEYCPNCGELEGDCGCEHCQNCGELEGECSCKQRRRPEPELEESRHDPMGMVAQLWPDATGTPYDDHYMSWQSGYAGEGWSIACAVWLKLYHSNNLGDMAVYIDKIYDLEHNNGNILDKNTEYQGRWLQLLLEIKLKAQNPEEIARYGSGYMQKFCRYLLHARYGRNWNPDVNPSQQMQSGYGEQVLKALRQALQQVGVECFQLDGEEALRIGPPGAPHNADFMLLSISVTGDGYIRVGKYYEGNDNLPKAWPVRLEQVPNMVQGIQELLKIAPDKAAVHALIQELRQVLTPIALPDKITIMYNTNWISVCNTANDRLLMKLIPMAADRIECISYSYTSDAYMAPSSQTMTGPDVVQQAQVAIAHLIQERPVRVTAEMVINQVQQIFHSQGLGTLLADDKVLDVYNLKQKTLDAKIVASDSADGVAVNVALYQPDGTHKAMPVIRGEDAAKQAVAMVYKHIIEVG